jgi:hypothetical protein
MTTPYVKITKLAETPGGLPAAAVAEHEPGSLGVEGKSLPIDYTIEGFLTEPVIVGCRVQVDRRKRNGVPIDGLFLTSPVVEVNEVGFRTMNSVYMLEFLSSQPNTGATASSSGHPFGTPTCQPGG